MSLNKRVARLEGKNNHPLSGLAERLKEARENPHPPTPIEELKKMKGPLAKRLVDARERIERFRQMEK